MYCFLHTSVYSIGFVKQLPVSRTADELFYEIKQEYPESSKNAAMKIYRL